MIKEMRSLFNVYDLIENIFLICCLILGILVFNRYSAGYSLSEFLRLHPMAYLFIGFIIILLIGLLLSIISLIKRFLKHSDKIKK